MTEYVVMRRDGSTALTLIGVVESNGPTAAIKALGDTSGELTQYVAVPKRNWTEASAGEFRPEPRPVVREVEPTFPTPGQTTIDEAIGQDAPLPEAPEGFAG